MYRLSEAGIIPTREATRQIYPVLYEEQAAVACILLNSRRELTEVRTVVLSTTTELIQYAQKRECAHGSLGNITHGYHFQSGK